ncbi:unnamed protein product [Pleuronectes platessa]|uniref:Uncharacterized protein n=1 Tax=Pleuronectes platessa TaxID=8262 RepID=A0A9N7Z3K9_PLEPL|nr:unnamed protein product [Pleuronectes platessa]
MAREMQLLALWTESEGSPVSVLTGLQSLSISCFASFIIDHLPPPAQLHYSLIYSFSGRLNTPPRSAVSNPSISDSSSASPPFFFVFTPFSVLPSVLVSVVSESLSRSGTSSDHFIYRYRLRSAAGEVSTTPPASPPLHRGCSLGSETERETERQRETHCIRTRPSPSHVGLIPLRGVFLHAHSRSCFLRVVGWFSVPPSAALYTTCTAPGSGCSIAPHSCELDLTQSERAAGRQIWGEREFGAAAPKTRTTRCASGTKS